MLEEEGIEVDRSTVAKKEGRQCFSRMAMGRWRLMALGNLMIAKRTCQP